MARSGKAVRKGVPRSVQRNAGGKPVIQLDMGAARHVWLLDLLAWTRHGGVALKIDMRGPRAPMPPVILPNVNGVLVALEDAGAVRRLRSRHRAFSQIAGRYTPLVVGAKDQGTRIVLEVWDFEGGDDAIGKLAPQLADFIGADVTVHDRHEAAEVLRAIDPTQIPASLVKRNPLAWQLQLLHGCVSEAAPEIAGEDV